MTDTSCYLGGIELSASDLLEESFQSVGRSHGYTDVEASFASFKEFKSTWRRSGYHASFQISDYLRGADRLVLEDFAESLFKRIDRKGRREIYTERLQAWLLSPQFVARNQSIYMKRSRNLSRNPQGQAYDLDEAYQRLVEENLVPEGLGAALNWTVRGNRLRVGYCSVLMRVVAISSILDSQKVPSYVHEYVLYHELLHIINGLEPGKRHHGPDFRQKERLHPRWQESEEWLKRLACRRVDGD